MPRWVQVQVPMKLDLNTCIVLRNINEFLSND